MDDAQIVALYWDRSEAAIPETAEKYGRYLHQISYQILADRDDADECVNDTYHDAWRSMPPHRPAILSTFLGKITRRISIDLWRKNNAEKRGGGQTTLVLHELEDCVPADGSIEDALVRQELIRLVGDFLAALPAAERRVFLCRYWYLDSIASIAEQFGFSQSKVTSMLYRTRKKLREHLGKEGYV